MPSLSNLELALNVLKAVLYTIAAVSMIYGLYVIKKKPFNWEPKLTLAFTINSVCLNLLLLILSCSRY
jgi:hypothetical protein